MSPDDDNPGSAFGDVIVEDLDQDPGPPPPPKKAKKPRKQKGSVPPSTNGGQPEEEQEDEDRPKQADLLVAFVSVTDLFTSPDGTTYADVYVDGHRETHPIRSPSFRRWLTHRFVDRYDTSPGNDAVGVALSVFEALCQYGPKASVREVSLRAARHNGNVYIDLCDTQWRIVEVTSQGWKVITRSPVRFRRTRGMVPLPIPTRGGDIKQLRKFLNVATDDDFVLVIAWLLAALAAYGPFTVLVVQGEHGAAKTFNAKLIRMLVDPHAVPTRRLPRDDTALSVGVYNSYTLSYDNISNLPQWASDALAAIATGAGSSARELYSNSDEFVFPGLRAIILTGIENVATRPDMADRAIYLQLQRIDDEHRLEEKKLLADFDAAHPAIFGALLDAIAHGLANEPQVVRQNLPRMADFAVWGQACEGALWELGTFINAFRRNQGDMLNTIIEADAVADAVRAFMFRQVAGEWSGTAGELLAILTQQVGDRIAQSKSWPMSARGMSGRLRRVASPLRQSGINVAFPDHPGQRSAAARKLTIKFTPPAAPPNSSIEI